MVDEEHDSFIQRCIALHNSGHIDLISLPHHLPFARVEEQAFFTAQRLYCEAIPKLDTNVTALMECCRILVERGGTALAAVQPNAAFRSWCQNHPDEGALVIGNAWAGDGLAKQFVTFALQATNDANSAIDFVQSFSDDRRLSGMSALAGMIFADVALAQRAIAALEPFVATRDDDSVRSNALLAAFEVLKQYKDIMTAERLIKAATKEAGPRMVHGLAQIVWQHYSLLNDQAMQIALLTLGTVNPENLGTVRNIDMALRRLLGTQNEALALTLLTETLRDGKLTVENFTTTAHELTNGDPQRLCELIVHWLLSGSVALCDCVSELIGADKNHAFDTTVQSLGLTPAQLVFLCRKAVGFLFMKPVACCSIIVSVLRAGASDVEGAVTELLFDSILLSYGGESKEYLKHIPETDLAYGPIQHALAKDKAFYADLDSTGIIKELHPSDYQRDVVRQRIHDEMQAARKMAESRSVLLNLIHRSTILYGKRTLTYITDYDGTQRTVSMDLKSVSTSIELPRRQVLDPVGLDYMLRVYRTERLK